MVMEISIAVPKCEDCKHHVYHQRSSYSTPADRCKRIEDPVYGGPTRCRYAREDRQEVVLCGWKGRFFEPRKETILDSVKNPVTGVPYQGVKA